VRTLLTCGVLYSALYAVANDVIAASLYDGYSRFSQAISELSATSAPSRPLLTALLPVFTALMLAFGLGVWMAAAGRRSLRVTGALLIAHAATFPLWLLAPMTSRSDMGPGTSMPANDVGHIVLSALAILFILGEVGFGAAALGKRFRLYSALTIVVVVAFGALTGALSPAVGRGEPTPWLGLVERISFAAWLLWLAVLAVALMPRRERSASRCA